MSAWDFAWSIDAVDTRFYVERHEFLQCGSYRLEGLDDFDGDKVPKLDITGSGIVGEWDSALQLKLFAAIMPVIVTAIHLKHDLYRLGLAPFARNESASASLVAAVAAARQQVGDGDGDRFSVFNLRYAFSSITPKPQSFAGNARAIEEYFRWYHVERAPYLQDRFTWVTLHTTNINVVLNLSNHFVVEAQIGEFSSDFMPKEVRIADTKLFLLDPAVHGDARSEHHGQGSKVLCAHVCCQKRLCFKVSTKAHVRCLET